MKDHEIANNNTTHKEQIVKKHIRKQKSHQKIQNAKQVAPIYKINVEYEDENADQIIESKKDQLECQHQQPMFSAVIQQQCTKSPNQFKKVKPQDQTKNDNTGDNILQLKSENVPRKKFQGQKKILVDKQKWENILKEQIVQDNKQTNEESQVSNAQADSANRQGEENTNSVCPDFNMQTAFPNFKTLSICFPDSIIAQAQSSELRSYFISQLARICVIFCVDEIIILKDPQYKNKSPNFDATAYIARNLQYLETPQYLRKHLFPMHPDLKFAGLLNPLECKHHLKSDEFSFYREGIIVDRPSKNVQEQIGCWVEIGLKKQVKVDIPIKVGTRVTVKLNQNKIDIKKKYYTGTLVSQLEPKMAIGQYQGYNVRIADSLKQVFQDTSFDTQYDLKIHVGNASEYVENSIAYQHKYHQSLRLKRHKQQIEHSKRLLIVFGNQGAIGLINDGDEQSKTNNIDNLFDVTLKLNQLNLGTKKLRLEEEMMIVLNKIREIK